MVNAHFRSKKLLTLDVAIFFRRMMTMITFASQKRFVLFDMWQKGLPKLHKTWKSLWS